MGKIVLYPCDVELYNLRPAPYNVTVEELEVRVERLEEDMFLVQDDVNELQYSLQETIETVSYNRYSVHTDHCCNSN